jgi:hypothetical protein
MRWRSARSKAAELDFKNVPALEKGTPLNCLSVEKFKIKKTFTVSESSRLSETVFC